MNGTSLEALYFADGIEDGEPFFERGFGQTEKPLPLFRSSMTANEAMEFIVDTLAISGAGEVRITGLRPKNFGAHPGFRFGLVYIEVSGLDARGMVHGAVIDGKLYVMIFLAPAEHYFDTYSGYVERMIDSLETPEL